MGIRACYYDSVMFHNLVLWSAVTYFPFFVQLDRETSTNDQVASRRDIVKLQLHISALEKLDAELIKREKLRAEVSFADQIRAAKNRKMEQAMAAPSVGVVNEKPGMHTHTLLQSQ